MGTGTGRSVARTHRDSGQEALRHVGYNDADEKDDGVQDLVLHGHGDDEEQHTDGDGYGRHNVDEVLDLHGDGRLLVADSRSQ